ncbi:TPA: superantigen-like protein SSL12 [Staphylococcus aureus]|uniref:superantigen-like protein SSL12 n=1 Tax=Staphylococcus aureus TaxID=1280 RepID=UPI00044A3B14|nr:superantigen-like protein SSL12 [Staphylococcus aureus]EZR34494.1 hypothetical protein V143_01728 [Staphylococcus aureus ZTA09/03739-9HSA]KAI66559.1 hypothetical protein V142_02119 [Staphylococcus aureus ZTA09/03734-9HSA]KAI70618.1 hypothetical protein V144_01975 [Staphylococcus aureus ZTA09/03745-9HSA]KAI80213.1 hypothetical protein V141_01835 [Staphylococcus aureus ZTA10/02412-8HSA]KAI83573.1 hypothetical protein V145_01959 [Staphylococcus aureus ZTA11/00189-8HSA]
MKRKITKKIILTTGLLLMGATAIQLPETPVKISSEAKAYSIGQDTTDITELTKYYTQSPQIFSYKWLRQRDSGHIYVDFTNYSWFGHIKVWGAESWGNINKLRNSYVDVFGIQDQNTERYFWTYKETFTGGITPAATSANKHYKLNVSLKDKDGKVIGNYQFYNGNKPVLTLKEVDFRIRQTLINNKKLYSNNHNTGEIKITGAENNHTIDLSKRLHSDRANVYVKNPEKAHIEVTIS